MKTILSIIVITFVLISSCKKEKNDDIVYQTTFTKDYYWFANTTDQYAYKVNPDNYEIDVNTSHYDAYAIAPCATINFDYSVSVDCLILLDDNKKLGAAGIMYNYYNENLYTFILLYTDGYFQVVKKEGTSYTILIQSTLNNTIKKGIGQINKIDVIQRSSSAEFKINNTLVGTLSTVKEFTSVRVGLLACTAADPYFTNVQAVFDNYVIKKM